MKFLYIILITISFFLFGCMHNHNNQSSINTYTFSSKKTLSEINDNLNFIAITDENNVILKLEAKEVHENDTDKVGTDTIIFYVANDEVRNFCVDDIQHRGHEIILEDIHGKVILSVTEGCRNINLKKGYYRLFIVNADEDIDHSVFITSLKKDDTLYTQLQKSSISSLKQSQTDTPSIAKTTLISFNVCKHCNLTGVSLSKLSFDSNYEENYLAPKMNNRYFELLDISEYQFFSIQNQNPNYSKVNLDVTGSIFYNADLSYSVFRDAIFDGVNFEDVNLSHAVFIDCSFKGTIFKNTNMQETVFIRPKFAKFADIESKVISKVSVAQLLRAYIKESREGSVYAEYYAYDPSYISAFFLDEMTMGLYTKKGDNGSYATYKAPKGLHFISPPSIARLNNREGFSSFVRMSDNQIYGYCSLTQKWEPLYNSATYCKSAPTALSWHLGNNTGDEDVTQLVVICHNNTGLLHSWSRTITKAENPVAWVENNYSIHDIFEGPISMNVKGDIAYIKDNQLHIKSIEGLVHQRNSSPVDIILSAEDITFSKGHSFLSSVDLRAFGDEVAVIMDNGQLYVGDYNHPFSTLGSPQNGFKSGPYFVKIEYNDDNYKDKIVVANGEGKIYYNDIFDTKVWKSFAINNTIDDNTHKSDLSFLNNNLNFTYLENGKLDSLDFTSNNLSNIFSYQMNFNKSLFKGMTLKNTYFYNSSFVESYFTGAIFQNLEWKSNFFINTIFDKSTFLDSTIVTNSDNIFKIRSFPYSIEMASFNHIVNFPIELLTGSDKILSSDARVLEDYNFTGVSFKNLEKLNFTNIFLKNLNFELSTLSNIDFSGSTIQNSNFTYAKMNKVIFDNTHLKNVSFYQIDMKDGSSRNAQWDNIKGAYGHFQNLNMQDINISSSDFSHASFNNSDLSFATFTNDVKVKGSSFVNAKLHAVNLKNIDFSDSDFSGANFDSIFDYSIFMQRDTDISGSIFENTIFNNAKLRCSNMRGVSISRASFEDANLSGVDLSSLPVPQKSYFVNANLSGVNFQDTDLGDANLKGAIFDFSGHDIIFSNGLSCPGHTTKPKTSSATICQDGENPEVKCLFK